MLQVNNVSYCYGQSEILHKISFKIKSGELMCVLGPNGCGKTTLLKNILGLVTPTSGSVRIDGEDVRKLSPKKLAQVMGYIPQAHTPPFPYTVFDVVLMGRAPYLSSLASPSQNDEKIANEVLDSLHIFHLKNKIYTKLSGGERQLVLIARALAQQPKLLIMDEPTSSLDFGKQNLVLEHVRLLSQKGISVLMVTHDPAHALFCADLVVTLKKGRVLQMGIPEEVISEESMKEIYDTEVKINQIKLPDDRDICVCVPIPKVSKCI